MSLTTSQKALLSQAIDALHHRTFFAAFPEHPAPAVYGETADAEGQAAFKGRLGQRFEELGQTGTQWVGAEESPYLQEPLGIVYPASAADELVDRARQVFGAWRKAPLDDRTAVLLSSLEGIRKRFFEVAYATMHTTGQGYMMAFQASGPHAADRALEAIAAGYDELTRFPAQAVWDKPMGKFNIQLKKEWRAVPKGISLVIGCSTFPTWNSVTGIYGSLITGNPVIVKPHPGAVLPIAIFVSEIRKAMEAAGLPADACQLAVDTPARLITKELAEHPAVKLIDFTGSAAFGNYLEGLKGKTVFTEKTGVNSVILDSVADIDKVAANLAFSVNLYSGQMCTAPQNFFIPNAGIRTPQGVVSFEEFAEKLVTQINSLIDNPKAGPFVLGAVQSAATLQRVQEADKWPGKVWLKSRTFENPMFKKARVATPVIAEVIPSQKELFSQELFGPIVFLVRTRDTGESVALARELAEQHGAISCGAYTTDAATRAHIADEMALAATPVSFNLTGGVYMNQNAAFSDFHVTGGNPSGNASFTNPDYINRRFTWVGHREPVG